MSQVHVVVDSTAQVPAEMLAAHSNLHIAALKVYLGDTEYLENEITTAELFQKEKAGKLTLKTSQPAPGDFLQVFEPLIKTGAEIVVITISGGISGTAEGARSAARMVDAKKIHVVDSRTTYAGMIQMARAALELAEAGAGAGDIASKLRDMAKVTHTFIVPETLEYLHKGGRIGGAAALFGSILQIRPVLYVDADGKVAVLDKVRTKQRAVNRMLEELGKYKELAYVAVGHVDAPDEVAALQARVREMFPGVPVLSGPLGAVLAAHLGPGLLGIVCQEK